MIVLARGSIADPSAVPPYAEDEMRVVGELKAEGVIRLRTAALAARGCTSFSKEQASIPCENEWTHFRSSPRV